MNDIVRPPESKPGMVMGRKPPVDRDKCRESDGASRLSEARRRSCAKAFGTERAPASVPASRVRGTGATDQVSFSKAVSDIRRYIEVVKSAAKADPGRLEELERAVKAGEYRVDPEVLANDLDFLAEDLGD